jgi:Ulp1 family protease
MSTVKSLIYHGVKPPTKEDAVLAKKHLDQTMSLEKTKVKEHQAQKYKARKAGHKKSVKYNESHIKSHQKDIKERTQSKKTINQIWDKLESMRSKQ